ncbi:lamin tail domain-containing protein [Anaerobaca lacustris]|uniref:Lamin tail domain-containing protein n=1 Tax=Anaerobaca lacustris TaxID=3044600 RepID=A0AAW6TP29_9BACT|nr:lamin tail domain-containing protein [Sedimentisphaerales bacterium M17dextr]
MVGDVKSLVLAVLLVLIGGTQAQSSIVINELLASNSQGARNPQGQAADWIELYSTADVPVDIGGMYLTDDSQNPTRWQVPAGTIVAPNGYVLIWADGAVDGEGLHASFKLSADGEEVALFDVDGVTRIDHIVFGPQRTDVSFGRYPDGTGEFRFLGYPTPGRQNVVVYDGFLSEPKVSHERGFYSAPFEVTITCDTPDAVIYYTRDGSEPFSQARDVPGGTVYKEPILVFRTTCLRVMAYKPGWRPSEIVTHSYIFLDDVLNQPRYPGGFPTTWGSTVVDYAMDGRVVNDPAYAPTIKDDLKSVPSVSVVLDNEDFFGAQRGIYANLSGRGVNWERAASIEWIDPIKGEDFQVNAGLRVHGSQYGRTSSVAKHSLRMLFKNEYGPSKLRYPLFADTDVETFESLVLRSIWNYSWFGDSTACGGMGTAHADYLRDQFCRDTVRDMGRLAPHSRGVHGYVNGLYWGMFIFVERPDDGFCAEHLGGEKQDYDVLVADGNMEVKTGDLQAWNTLFRLAAGNVSATAAYEEIQQYVDIPTMIDYMLMIYYVGSRDAPVLLCNDRVPRNFYAVRRRAPAGPFLFVPWDVEWSLESPTVNRVNIVGQSNPHYLIDRLMANEDFRVRMADHIYKRFFNDGVLTPGASIERYMARADEIHGAIVGESARWGDSRRSQPYTRDVEWLAERDRLVNNYFPVRTDVVMNQLRQAGFYPSISPPQFYVDGRYQYGGPVRSSAALTMTASAGEIWYTTDGSDPRVPGSGGGSGTEMTLVPEEAAKRVTVPTGPVDSAWRGGAAFDDSAWIGGTGGVGYERSTGYEPYFQIDLLDAMYGVNSSCYIRIPFEVAASDLADLSSLVLKARYDDGFIAYINGVEACRMMFDGSPTWNSSATANHSDLDAVELEPFNASAALGALRVGRNILAIQGLNAGSTSSDFLISVELIAGKGGLTATPSGVSPTALRYSRAWMLARSTPVKARTLSGTTWSALADAVFAVGPVAEGLRISEIMYNPIDPNAEYVELTNVGDETINLNLVQFARGIDFAFGDVELLPGHYVLVVRDLAVFEATYGDGLPVAGQYGGRLDNAGERIELRDAAGEVICDFRYRDDWYGITDGLGFSLTVRDPGAEKSLNDKDAWRPSARAGGSPGFDDTAIVPDLGAVVINEILTYPGPGESDWIELHNTTDEAIDLGGWFLSDNASDLMRYEIAAGTVLEAGGYLVFGQDETFGNASDPGCRVPFGLSRNGETLYLHSGENGELTGYSVQEKFGASEIGVSLGRHHKSTGGVDFVPLSVPTPGVANAAPKVGPVVISEIMYNPVAPDQVQYVELRNISGEPVMLYDEILGVPWRFSANPDNPQIELLFPGDEPVILAPGGCLLVVKDMLGFSLAYSVSDEVAVLAWGRGTLSAGATIELAMPGAVAADGEVAWIPVDRVAYSDGSHPADLPAGVDPWPAEADGQGLCLHRIDPMAYGNDPANWQAAPPGPGALN